MTNNYYFAASRLEKAIDAGDEFDTADLRELISYAKETPRITLDAVALFTSVEWAHRFMVYNGGASCRCGWFTPDPESRMTLDRLEELHRVHQITKILEELVQRGDTDEQ